LDQVVVDYQIKYLIFNDSIKIGVRFSDEEDPSIYYSFIPTYVEELVKRGKGIIFYNEKFIYGIIGHKDLLPEKILKDFIESTKRGDTEIKYITQNSVKVGKKKVEGIYQFTVFNKFSKPQLDAFFKGGDFTPI
jgi:hypothetical protein